ncbi:MAG: class I SAM-dependent methyltransferase, partial [Planctomycetota bacterium]|nr:class I SAM-dependent methyltransferase [Planctomycetota bacterium]
MLNLRSAADVHSKGSLSNRMRSARFAKFEGLVSELARPLKIIDIGGTNAFWEQRGWAGREDVHIVTVNLAAEPRVHSNIEPVVGDATSMPQYADGSFDVAFSNSVIEHLFTLDAQRKMAGEVRRVARAYWVQTPNFWFPMEPHFHVPGWQWMPVSVRVAMLRRMRCGWRGPEPDAARARAAVEEVRLLTGREMRALFPGAKIWAEKLGGLTKSWVAYQGF